MEAMLLTASEVARAVGMHRTTVYKLIRQGKFPPPLKTTSKASRWRFNEITQWVENLGR